MIRINKKLLIETLSKSQKELFKYFMEINPKHIDQALNDKYIILKKDNKTKPLLCVHLDTINTHSKCKDDKCDYKHIVVFDEGMMLKPTTSLSCLGADDRAGVYIILNHYNQLIEKYHIGVFCDEEIGAKGSGSMHSLEHVSCFIGLDREGSKQVATYGYDNAELLSKFTNLGFTERMGSFTDASVLAQMFNLACCNLSVGYYYQHTANEYVLFDDISSTIELLLNVDLIFDKEDYPIETTYYGYNYGISNKSESLFDDEDKYGLWNDTMDECYHCGKVVNDGNLNNELVWGHCPHCFTALVDTAEEF